MKDKKEPRARYGSGSLFKRGEIWHIQWRTVKRNPGGKSEYILHRETTG